MANADSVSVRVFSLNSWGIHYLSKHVRQRYAMIGDMLSKEKHDVVLLQEVWSEKDFLFLKQKLSSCHPHSHHFKRHRLILLKHISQSDADTKEPFKLRFLAGSSGVIGSGLAIFSQHRIQDAFLYRYSLNGYPYMAHHGDWFGGKAVGLAILNIGSLTANVYVTHLHAEYCRDRDAYLPHRVVQAWELQQFVRHTSAGADVVILGGDLNMHPQDLGCRLLRTSTGLRDSYLETSKFDGCENGVTLIPENPFICEKELGPFDKGIRIDYIMFKGSSRANVCCDFMCTTKGSVADQPFPYSDHEAVTAHLRLKARTTADMVSESPNSSAGKVAELVDIVTEARTEVKVGLHCAERMRSTAARTGVMGLALLFLELAIVAVSWLALDTDQPFPRVSFYMLAALCVAILLTTSLLYVFYTMELKSLQGAEDQMRLIVGSLQAKLKDRPWAELGTEVRSPPEGLEPNDLDLQK